MGYLSSNWVLPIWLAIKPFVPHASIVARMFESTPPEDCFYVCGNAVVCISAVLLKPGTFEVSSLKPCDTSAEIKGKFYELEAVALGLDAGTKCNELKHGKSVKSDRLNGVINPCHVMEPAIQGPIILKVDCPTEAQGSYITHILSKFTM